MVPRSESAYKWMVTSDSTATTLCSWISDAHQTAADTREDPSTGMIQVREAVGAPFRDVLPVRDEVDRIFRDYLVPLKEPTRRSRQESRHFSSRMDKTKGNYSFSKSAPCNILLKDNLTSSHVEFKLA